MKRTAIEEFTLRKQAALEILNRVSNFIQLGSDIGVETHPDLARKVRKALDDVQDERLRIALIGGFSEGKTSIAAAWLERLDKTSMKICHQESSNEVKVYEVDDKMQLIDTPGLFGFKEQVNFDTQAIEKYKDITKRYVSEAHLVLYVMNSANPIKESHGEDLQWLFRSLNLLPRTVFVLSRFDEVADVADESDYLEKLSVKKASIAQRLDHVLKLTPDERNAISIVAVAANPFDLGTEHWLAHMDEFRQLSHIDTLQAATDSKVRNAGGAIALANEVKKSIISDVIQNQLPVARDGFERLHQESQRLAGIRRDQETELGKVSRKIADARLRLRGRIIRYFEDLLLQVKGVSVESFNDFFHREVGNGGLLIDQHIQEIFSDEVNSIAQDLGRIQIQVQAEIDHFDNVMVSLGKQGLAQLAKGNLITRESVLLVRNGIGSVAKFAGIDLGGLLKFKPWGATKLASGLNGALSVVGIGFELWDSWKEEERKREFMSAMRRMQESLTLQCQEVVTLVDGPDFSRTFFPALDRLQGQLQSLQAEVDRATQRYEQFRQWYDYGRAIDVEFREVNADHVQTSSAQTEPALSAATGRPKQASKPRSGGLWNRLFD